jgi:rhodanese-related sulfurtransferase
MSSATRFFTERLQFQTDPSDVYAALDAGTTFALIDTRGEPGWRQGHIPGALHLPTAEIPTRAGALINPATPVVTYCWGPGCNGATRAALAFAQLGYQVKEMIGGVEYWIREGLPLDTPVGTVRRPVDPLTAPMDTITCDC